MLDARPELVEIDTLARLATKKTTCGLPTLSANGCCEARPRPSAARSCPSRRRAESRPSRNEARRGTLRRRCRASSPCEEAASQFRSSSRRSARRRSGSRCRSSRPRRRRCSRSASSGPRLSLGSSTISWSQPTPVLRSAMARASGSSHRQRLLARVEDHEVVAEAVHLVEGAVS